MTMAQPYRLAALSGAALLALSGLTGCAMDREAKVRALLGAWVELGSTTWFRSTMDCTAAVFRTETPNPAPEVQQVRSVRQGLMLLGHDITVGFGIGGLSPTQISEKVMQADLPKGLGVLSAGLAARGCMDEATERSYLSALGSEHALLIFVPSRNVLAVLDRAGQQIFFARGNV